MIIDLEPGVELQKKIEKEFVPDEIDLDGEYVSLEGPTTLSAELNSKDGRAVITGNISAKEILSCSRCLESVNRDVEIAFRSVFVTETDDAEEALVEGDDLDESFAIDGKINIAEVVREEILLETPEKVFCRENCRGLCPKCGENLNLIDCKCEENEIDPRWAALKNIN